MTAGRCASMAAITCVWTALLSAQQQPGFRATSLGVSVDVSVKRGNTPLANLTAKDFILTDNGVTQTVQSVQIEEVPVDVTLAVDVSGSTRGLLGRYRSDILAISTLLRPFDRLRLIAFGTSVEETVPLGPIAGRPPVDRLAASSNSAVYDGIMAALVREVGPDRRHLVVAFTDGYDNRSVTTPASVAAAARRTGAVVHVVSAPPPRMDIRAQLGQGLFWPPVPLDDIAETTGGQRHTPASWITEAGGPLVSDFRRIFNDFRQSYVLRYTPAGVEVRGWHDLTVKLAIPGNYTIRARRGYFAGGR